MEERVISRGEVKRARIRVEVLVQLECGAVRSVEYGIL